MFHMCARQVRPRQRLQAGSAACKLAVLAELAVLAVLGASLRTFTSVESASGTLTYCAWLPCRPAGVQEGEGGCGTAGQGGASRACQGVQCRHDRPHTDLHCTMLCAASTLAPALL